MVELDCYEELSQKRCLELNSDNLREKFQELSKCHHPDAGGDELVFFERELIRGNIPKYTPLKPTRVSERGRIPKKIWTPPG